MTDSTDMLKRASRRLLVSISVLLAIALAMAIFASSMNSDFVVPMVVIISGSIGGFVGLQRRLKDMTADDLRLINDSAVYTWLSPLVGGVLALLLYVLFLSELLSGELFPAFDADNVPRDGFASIFDQHAASGYQDYAKLIFWCFIAGFSERFVTNVIGQFEGEAIKYLPGSGAQDGTPPPPPATEAGSPPPAGGG